MLIALEAERLWSSIRCVS
ncbi:hypothetical protein AVEN_106825-1, partial [Araneus ventricosus]